MTANYANRCTDGESAKSTGTGMKHSGDAMNKSLDPAGAGAWRDRIVQLAARLARAPRALTTHEQGTLLRELKLWLEGYTLSDGNRSMVCRGVSDGRAPLFK